MMRSLLISIFGVLAIGSVASATFLPTTELESSFPLLKSSSTTEAEFNQAITQIQTAYAPIVKNLGGRLSIKGSWKNDRLNAGATQMLGSWKVVISGALARRPELTVDGLSLIICHEVGHHLGGFAFAEAPTPLQGTWAANEGQSDYFSTQVCARKIWADEHARNAEFRLTVAASVKSACDQAWSAENDQNLCYRINTAVNSMTNTMAGILRRPAPTFESPSTAVVTQTYHGHPAIQCRMDTAFQASQCDVPFSDKLIPGKNVSGGRFGIEAEREAAASSCFASSHPRGARPTCWFAPRL